MTTHTFRIELAQRHTVRYAHGDKTPSPPRLSEAAHIVYKVTGCKIPLALQRVNESIPFQADFRKMLQAGPNLNDAGYKAVVVPRVSNSDYQPAKLYQPTRPMTDAERQRKHRGTL